MQGLHNVGYTGALARPLICPEEAVGGLSADMLSDFVAKNYTAGSIVLAGAGIEHKELVSLAEPLFSNVPDSNKGQHQSKYVGGDFRQVFSFILQYQAQGPLGQILSMLGRCIQSQSASFAPTEKQSTIG